MVTWLFWLLLSGIFPWVPPLAVRPVINQQLSHAALHRVRVQSLRRRSLLLEMIRNYRIPKVTGTVSIMDDIDFHMHFRMKRSTFEILVRVARPPPHPAIRLAPHKEMLVFLWWIATSECYRSVANRFGIAKSTAHSVVTRLIKSITFFLRDVVIRWPQGEARIQTARKFFALCGLPNVIGAVDGCHIEILAPNENPDSYYNRNKDHSVLLMAVCDADKMLTHISIGFPGRTHDSRALERSAVGKDIPERYGNNFYLLGDSAFTQQQWLMASYKNVTQHMLRQKDFNKIHSKGRVVIENLFADIKNVSRKLVHMEGRRFDLICKTVEVACCLHNFVKLHEGAIWDLPPINGHCGAIVENVPQDRHAYREWLSHNY